MNSPENAALRAELTFLRDRLEKIERGSPPTDVRAERSMSLTAIFLEDRLKALALAIVAIVFVGFVLVYLQSVLKLVTLAALLAILLQPLVDVLSVRPAAPARWATSLRASCCGGSCEAIGALIEWSTTLRLPRWLAIVITLAVVFSVGTLIVILVYNTLYSFILNIDEYLHSFIEGINALKEMFKETTLGGYIDVDTFSDDMVKTLADASFLQPLLINSMSVAGGLIANMLVTMIMWIFLVMSPPTPEAPASEAARDTQVVVATALSAAAQTRLYLRWKAAISLGKAVACGLVYLFVGLPLWPIFAVLVFWLNWIPVVGGLVAIVLPVPMALVDPEMTWAAFIVMLIATTVVQIVVDNFIDQIVISRALVLHPLTIMIGLFTSRLLWGIVGMVLSIPLLGSLKTTLAGTAHPYAQALAAVLEGDMQKAEAVASGQPPRPPPAPRRGLAWQRLRVACGRLCCGTPSGAVVGVADDDEDVDAAEEHDGLGLLGGRVFADPGRYSPVRLGSEVGVSTDDDGGRASAESPDVLAAIVHSYS